MGFSFNFFGKQEVRRFNYKPRFYDPETEERRKKYGDFTKPQDEEYAVPCVRPHDAGQTDPPWS